MIDLKPDQPGGEVAFVVILWVLAGIVGLCVRFTLLRKYATDLYVSRAQQAPESRLAVSRDRIRSTLFHITVKVIVIIIGLGVAWSEYNSPVDTAGPITTTALGVLLIPILLTTDALLEWRAQRKLLPRTIRGKYT